MDPSHADAAIQARTAADPGAAGAGAIVGGVIGPTVQLAGWPFTIHVEVPMAGIRFVREVTVRLTGDSGRPFWILATRRTEQ
jgi:hypothetical protein